jgi:hypothetical protein
LPKVWYNRYRKREGKPTKPRKEKIMMIFVWAGLGLIMMGTVAATVAMYGN